MVSFFDLCSCGIHYRIPLNSSQNRPQVSIVGGVAVLEEVNSNTSKRNVDEANTNNGEIQ